MIGKFTVGDRVFVNENCTIGHLVGYFGTITDSHRLTSYFTVEGHLDPIVNTSPWTKVRIKNKDPLGLNNTSLTLYIITNREAAQFLPRR